MPRITKKFTTLGEKTIVAPATGKAIQVDSLKISTDTATVIEAYFGTGGVTDANQIGGGAYAAGGGSVENLKSEVNSDGDRTGAADENLTVDITDNAAVTVIVFYNER